jgi:predicted dehydrogenase
MFEAVSEWGLSLDAAVKVGVIGLGKMGILHAGIINSTSDASVTAISEKEGFLTTAAKAFLPKRIAVYKDYQKMIAEEQLDAVFITTPIDTHASIAEDLLKSSTTLSIFVEKPLAASYEQAKVACEAAARSRGVHMVGFQKRFSPVFQKAKQLIEQRNMGDPMFFRGYCFSSDVLRDGSAWRFRKNTGGVLLDSAPHLLDLLIWFFGEPTTVAAVKKHVYSSEVEDYVHAMMSYESGLQGHVDACWSISNFRLPEFLIEVYGRDGILTVTDDYVRFAPGRGSGKMGGGQTYHRQSFETSPPFLLADIDYTMEDIAFINAARTRAAPEPSFLQAAKVNALIDKILESTQKEMNSN